jgi:DNA-binding NtrC family response regulator
MTRKKRILLFVDFESIRNILIKTIEKKEAQLVVVKTLNDAITELNGLSFSLLITDIDNKNDSATQLIKRMRQTTSYLFTPIILLTSGSKQMYTERLSEFNIAGYIQKPFDIVHFSTIIDRFS